MKPIIIIAALSLLLLFAGCTQTKVQVDEWKGDDGHWYRGAKDATVTLLEFSDFQCPFCGKAQPTIDRILATYGNKIKFSFRHFPLEQIHPYALQASYAAECAGDEDKFWAMHDKLFANQNALTQANLIAYGKELGLDEAKFSACINSDEKQALIDADMTDGEDAGIQGTPTFMVNNVKIVGAESYEKFSSVIDAELKRTAT
jgi:protein-disulfide isomerase